MTTTVPNPVTPITLPSGTTAWLVTGYAAALNDPRLVKAGAPRTGPYSDLLPPGVAAAKDNHLLNLDPPDHTRLRKLVAAAFTRRRVDALAPRVQQVTDDLLDALDGPGEVDPTVICELLGVPDAGRTDFRAWSNTILAGMLAGPDAFVAAWVAMIGYVRELGAAKRREPADDLLSALIAVRDGPDRLIADELTLDGVPAAGGRARDDGQPDRQRGARAAHPPRAARAPARRTRAAEHGDRGAAAVRRSVAGQPYLPHALLLPRCALVVSQGGAGILFGALAHGLPQLVLPQGAEQPLNAEAAVRAGAALALSPDEVTAGSVAAAAGRLLAEAPFTTAARAVRAEIESMPSAEQVLATLEGNDDRI